MRWRVPATATPTERLDHVERLLGTEAFPLMPDGLPVRRGRVRLLAVARGLLRRDLDPPRSRRGAARRCRTTSPPRWTWSCGRWPADPGRRRGGRGAPRAGLRRPSWHGVPDRALPAAVQRGLADFLAATATGRWPRSTRACPAGPRSPSTCSGVMANYLRLDDPRPAPGRPVRAPARRPRGDRSRELDGAGPAAGRVRAALVGLARWAGPRAGRPAGDCRSS